MAPTRFPQFARLPVELQLMIWKYAVGTGAKIHCIPWLRRNESHTADYRKAVRRWFNEMKLSGGGNSRFTGAALLHVCQISREVASPICK